MIREHDRSHRSKTTPMSALARLSYSHHLRLRRPHPVRSHRIKNNDGDQRQNYSRPSLNALRHQGIRERARLVTHLPEYDDRDEQRHHAQIDRHGEKAVCGGIGFGVFQLRPRVLTAGQKQQHDRCDKREKAQPCHGERHPRGGGSRSGRWFFVSNGFKGEVGVHAGMLTAKPLAVARQFVVPAFLSPVTCHWRALHDSMGAVSRYTDRALPLQSSHRKDIHHARHAV